MNTEQAQDKTEEESAKIKKQNSGLVDENTELKKKLANMEREIEVAFINDRILTSHIQSDFVTIADAGQKAS